MKGAARAVVGGVALILAVGTCHAMPSGHDLLLRSERAERIHSYRGVRTIHMAFRDRAAQGMVRVIHRKPATTRTEYLSPPAMAGTVTLQLGDECWRRLPRDSRWQRAAPASGISNISAIGLLTRNYNLRVTDGSSVTGRRCLLLIITPKHPGNPSKRIWVDQATGLVLRTELRNWADSVISSSVFRQIETNPDLADDANLLLPPARIPTAASAGPLGFRPSYPRYLPPGYAYSGAGIMSVGKHRASHLRYSDGLNSISIFQAPAIAFGGQQPFASQEWHFTQVITWTRGYMAYAVVGDVDPTVLRKIADSMGLAAPERSR